MKSITTTSFLLVMAFFTSLFLLDEYTTAYAHLCAVSKVDKVTNNLNVKLSKSELHSELYDINVSNEKRAGAQQLNIQ